MQDTRYWKKIAEGGGFWSKCKDQENTNANDGRQLYKYTKPNPGERYQYETRQFGGVIEAFYIKDGKYGKDLCIGIKSEDRVNVLQIKVWDKPGKLSQDFKGIAKKIPNLNIDDEMDFSTWTNIKGKREWTDDDGNKHTNIPTYIMVYQDNGAMRTPTKSAFDYVDGAYVGIPAPDSAKLGDRTVYDYEKPNKFLLGLVEDFAAKHKSLLDERQNAREATPAEAAVPAGGNVSDEDDIDFG